MLKIIKQISILVLLVLILVFPYFVFGADETPPPVPTMKGALEGLGGASGYSTAVTEKTVSEIAGTAVSVFLSVLAIVFVALMLYGGYIWMMARGSEEEVNRAKDLIKAAIIGLIIIVAAYAISFFIFDRITRQTLTTPSGSGGGSGGAVVCTPPKVDNGHGGCSCPSGEVDDGQGGCHFN